MSYKAKVFLRKNHGLDNATIETVGVVKCVGKCKEEKEGKR